MLPCKATLVLIVIVNLDIKTKDLFIRHILDSVKQNFSSLNYFSILSLFFTANISV